MSHDIYYFSGSGNSLHIADTLNAAVPGRIHAIGALDPSKPVVSDAETAGIVFPVYFMDKPDIVTAFISRLETRPGAYVYFVASCGAMAGNTLANTARQLARRGITLSAGFLLFLPDNSVIFPTPDERIAPMLDFGERYLSEIARAVASRQRTPVPRSSIPSAVLTAISKPLIIRCGGFGRLALDAAKCTRCGICKKVCPVQNITRPSGTPEFGPRCESCLACLHWCPAGAITLPKQKRKSGFQYTHPKVGREELISANGRG